MTQLFDPPAHDGFRPLLPPGEECFVPLGQCLVDRLTYQRAFRPQNVARLRANFIPDLVPFARGSRRPDGRVALIDGGHRLELLRSLDYTHLPVIVEEKETVAAEAGSFVALNSGAKDTMLNSYRAHTVSGHDRAIMVVHGVLRSLSIAVSGHGTAPGGDFAAVGTALAIYRRGCGAPPVEARGAQYLHGILGLALAAWPGDRRALCSFMLVSVERFLLLWESDAAFTPQRFVRHVGRLDLSVLCAQGSKRGRMHGSDRFTWALRMMVEAYNKGSSRPTQRLDAEKVLRVPRGGRGRRPTPAPKEEKKR